MDEEPDWLRDATEDLGWEPEPERVVTIGSNRPKQARTANKVQQKTTNKVQQKSLQERRVTIRSERRVTIQKGKHHSRVAGGKPARVMGEKPPRPPAKGGVFNGVDRWSVMDSLVQQHAEQVSNVFQNRKARQKAIKLTVQRLEQKLGTKFGGAQLSERWLGGRPSGKNGSWHQ